MSRVSFFPGFSTFRETKNFLNISRESREIPGIPKILSERAHHCFPSNLFCTNNSFYISSSKCRDLGNLTSYPLPSFSNRTSLSKPYPEPKLAAFIAEVEDQMAEFAYSLEEQNRLLHCQLERSLGIIANTVGRLFPTEILSLAKGKPTFGIAYLRRHN